MNTAAQNALPTTPAGNGVMYAVFMLISLTFGVFWVLMLLDCWRRQFDKPHDRLIWLLVILCLGLLGALIYYCKGRPKGRLPSSVPARPGF